MGDNLLQSNDYQLIIIFKEGNDDAFGELYRRYYKWIRNYLFKLCKDEPLSEDLTQDVFIKAMIAIKVTSKYEEKTQFQAWLTQISRNLYFDLVRRKKTFSFGDGFDTKMALQFLTEGEPMDRIVKFQSTELLHKLIQKLSIEQREFAILRYFYDFDISEIALMTNCPYNTALSRSKYIKENLYKIIKKGEFESEFRN